MKGKNQISVMLMAVGVLFVMVAGGMFLSRAWQYLPDAVRRLLILAAACGLFAGAAKAERAGLGKTGQGLFILADVFLGLFVYAFCSAAQWGRMQEELGSSCVGLAMGVPFAVRFWKKRKGLDLAFATLLLYASCVTLEKLFPGPVLLALTLFVYALTIAYQSKGTQVLRFLQSISLLWWIGEAVCTVNELLPAASRMRSETMLYASLFAGLVLMLWLERRGFAIVLGAFSLLASFSAGFHGAILLLFVACGILENEEKPRRIFWTAAVLVLEKCAFCQQWFAVPNCYKVEYVCALIGTGVALIRLIWYAVCKDLALFAYIAVCLLLAFVLLKDMTSGAVGIGNVLILGMVCGVMLAGAAFLNNRRYAASASVVLVLLVTYLTRRFWLSIEWWIYLFAAGVVLIALAVHKEREGQKGD